MSSAAQAKTLYESHFSEMEKGGLPNGKAWIRNLRERAMARFNELGFPTSRNEEWKYTDVAPIASTVFQPARRVVDRVAAEAAAHFDAARATFTAVHSRYELGRTYLDLAALARAQGNRDAVTANLRAAHRLFRLLKVDKYVGLTVHLARQLGVALGEDAESR